MRIISLGTITYQIIYPILVSLFCLLHSYAYFYFIRNNALLKDYNAISLVLDSFSLLLCGILSLISNCLFVQAKKEKHTLILTKHGLNKKAIEINQFSFLSINDEDSFPLLFIFLTSICNLLHMLTYYMFVDGSDMGWLNELSKCIQVIISALLCYLVFHIKVYRHNYFSFFNLLLFAGILGLINYNGIFEAYSLIGNVFISLLYSIYEVIEKYIMNKTYLSPYTLLFFEGLILMIISCIILIIFNNIECKDTYEFCNHKVTKHLFEFKQLIFLLKDNPMLLLNIILYMLVYFLFNVFRIFTIKEFSPIYRTVADCFVFVFIFIISVCNGNFAFDINLIFKAVCHIMIVVSLLVYNEVIIVHFWKLDVNTEVEIKKRSMDDCNEVRELFQSKAEQMEI